jgi:hypothetical protein
MVRITRQSHYPIRIIADRVEPPGGLASFHDTGVSGEIRFADGSVFVNGTIGLGAVDIAGHQIPTQGGFLLSVLSTGYAQDYICSILERRTGEFSWQRCGFGLTPI